LKALVLSARSGHFKCKLDNGDIVVASARKKIMGGADRNNPIVAGDEVDILSQGETHTIESLLPRQTLIERGSEKRRGRTHTIVANMDHALVVFASSQPRSRVSGIDRYLVACEYQNLDVTLVFNKWDLADDEAIALAETYEKAGYSILRTQAIDNPEKTRATILAIPFRRVYVLGPSGVGKSTITNALIPGHGAATGEVNEVTGKGRQTTTHIELVALEEDRYLADTPGLGHLAMLGIEPSNLKNLYREMFALAPNCRYPNCLHLHEPDCAVKTQVGESVSRERYQSYCDFYTDLVQELEDKLERGPSRH
jgi:ribosome biogenesis GTPase / thiamine phosphate phosphatase